MPNTPMNFDPMQIMGDTYDFNVGGRISPDMYMQQPVQQNSPAMNPDADLMANSMSPANLALNQAMQSYANLANMQSVAPDYRSKWADALQLIASAALPAAVGGVGAAIYGAPAAAGGFGAMPQSVNQTRQWQERQARNAEQLASQETQRQMMRGQMQAGAQMQGAQALQRAEEFTTGQRGINRRFNIEQGNVQERANRGFGLEEQRIQQGAEQFGKSFGLDQQRAAEQSRSNRTNEGLRGAEYSLRKKQYDESVEAAKSPLGMSFAENTSTPDTLWTLFDKNTIAKYGANPEALAEIAGETAIDKYHFEATKAHYENKLKPQESAVSFYGKGKGYLQKPKLDKKTLALLVRNDTLNNQDFRSVTEQLVQQQQKQQAGGLSDAARLGAYNRGVQNVQKNITPKGIKANYAPPPPDDLSIVLYSEKDPTGLSPKWASATHELLLKLGANGKKELSSEEYKKNIGDLEKKFNGIVASMSKEEDGKKLAELLSALNDEEKRKMFNFLNNISENSYEPLSNQGLIKIKSTKSGGAGR